ncbi:zinc finger domain-containing protein [Micromonospora sediminimaris]
MAVGCPICRAEPGSRCPVGSQVPRGLGRVVNAARIVPKHVCG